MEYMAEELGIGQDGISRLEKRSDLLLSTLRSYIEAMGGKLRLVAEFPNRPPVFLAGFQGIAGMRSPAELNLLSLGSEPKSMARENLLHSVLIVPSCQ